MNTLSIALPILVVFASPVLAQSIKQNENLNTWVNEEKKVVEFLPSPVYKAKITPLQSDEDYWDELTVSFSYAETAPDFERNSLELKKKYPGYQFSRVLMTGVTSPHLSIPSINIDKDISFKLSTDGPYYRESFFIPKSKSYTVRQALNSPDFIRLTGALSFIAPIEKTVESQTLPASICDELVSDGGTVYSLMNQFIKLSKRIDNLSLKYNSTKEGLKLGALETCLVTPNNLFINTFTDVLNLKVERRATASEIVADTKKTVYSEASIPLPAASCVKEISP